MIVKVNFSPEDSAVPNEFITDSGAGYSSDRGYGWVSQSSLNSGNPTPIDISSNTRDRDSNSGFAADTLIHLQYPEDLVSPIAEISVKTPSAWEHDIANGSYFVTVGVGDSDFTDSSHTINIEGESAISDFVPTEDLLFTETTALVEVTDGKITIDAVGGDNTKLNFVEITPESDFNAGDDNSGDEGDTDNDTDSDAPIDSGDDNSADEGDTNNDTDSGTPIDSGDDNSADEGDT
ncbi:MAG: hypothetical protein ACFCAD_20160, partial [Pleurocapsa sp.]